MIGCNLREVPFQKYASDHSGAAEETMSHEFTRRIKLCIENVGLNKLLNIKECAFETLSCRFENCYLSVEAHNNDSKIIVEFF